MDREWLDTAEATEQLGVKAQTLYAYVSRGLVHSEPVPAGPGGRGSRTRRYRRADVERLAERGTRRRVAGDGPEVVLDTAVTRLDPEGRLAYRGWDVTEAVRTARFEEVAAWLWGIAIRRLVSRLRGRREALVLPLEEVAAARAPEPSAEERVLLGLEYGDLGTALMRLSPELRAVVQATVLDGLTTREAARLLGIPANTAKTRLHRAKAHLRQDLTEGLA